MRWRRPSGWRRCWRCTRRRSPPCSGPARPGWPGSAWACCGQALADGARHVGATGRGWPPARSPATHGRWWAEFRTGLLTNLPNPKVALFFLAFLPQFVPAASPAKTLSFLLLGAWFVLQSLVFSLALVALAARLSRLRPSPLARRLLLGLGGGLFIALAARLLSARTALA